MSMQKIYAQVACADLAASESWYSALFNRSPDARPMEGLLEWHHHESAGLQLFQSAENAGYSTLTIIVEGLRNEHDRLQKSGLAPGVIESATTTSLVRLNDPDGNLVVLAQPGRV